LFNGTYKTQYVRTAYPIHNHRQSSLRLQHFSNKDPEMLQHGKTPCSLISLVGCVALALLGLKILSILAPIFANFFAPAPPKVVVELTKEEREEKLEGYPKFDYKKLVGEKNTVHYWDPSTLDYFGSTKAMNKADVCEAVKRARAAQDVWRNSTFKTRKLLMRTMLRYITENLQYMYVDDEASTMEVVRMGLRNRRVHSTTYNMNSSRSHAIFQMYLDFEERDEASAQSQKAGNNSEARKLDIRRRVLTFVDLAGSERVQTHHQAKSKAQFKEAVAINKSISALGNCIQALASMSQQQQEGSVEGGGNAFLSASSGSNKISHVPFRDCKLTRLLAEPLGGNSKTCIIVNIGPCAYNLEETSSTLKFARRWVLSLVFTPVLLASFWFVCRAMTIRKRVKKGEIEQLQVQEVLSEATSPVRAPSPPRISLGGKKVTSMKVARVVVRDSPEERQQGRHRYADSEQDVTHSVDFGEGQPGEKEEYAGTLSRSNSGYFLHLPAGSAFDRYGSQHEGAELGGPAPQSVRLNLGDFLRACQAGGLGG
jgi:hypothetical protein